MGLNHNLLGGKYLNIMVSEISLTSPLPWIYFTMMIRKNPKYYCLYSTEDLGMKSIFSGDVVNVGV